MPGPDADPSRVCDPPPVPPPTVPARASEALRGLGMLAADLPAALTPAGAHGVLRETAWGALHLVGYPWGLVRERPEPADRYRTDALPPRQRGLLVSNVAAAGTPVLLVHGMIDNRAIFRVLRRRLRGRGFGTLVAVNYPLTTNDVRAAARDLAGEVEAVVAVTGYEHLHVVGHSLGGLIARYYVQRLGGDERVGTLVTLGSPHSGSLHGHLLPVRLCRQLRPGSGLMTELAGPAPGCRTRFVAYWSDMDQLIVPHHGGRVEHPDLDAVNVLVARTGHLSLPRDRWVGEDIADRLAAAEHPAEAHPAVPGTAGASGRTGQSFSTGA